MRFPLLNDLAPSEKDAAVKSLIEHSSPRQSFFFMVALSILMATFGLLANSVVIIIGSMLVAPLLYPLLSLSLGVVIADRKLIGRSFYTLAKSCFIGIALAALTTLIFSRHDLPLTSEILSRSEYSLAYAAVAVIAGLAASFAFLKPQVNEGMAGVAISVALIPPLAVIGVGIARFDWLLIRGSLVLFLINVLGVVFASMIVFSIMNLHVEKKVAIAAVKKDEAQIKKEIEKAIHKK